MAQVTFFRNHLAVGADVLSIVATKTSAEIEMTNIIRVSLPVHLHFRKRGPLVNLLHLIYSITNFELFAFGQVRILCLVKFAEAFSDSLKGQPCVVEMCAQCGNCLLLQVRQ